jgi:tetratricopeptide (TPR) repeat protein
MGFYGSIVFIMASVQEQQKTKTYTVQLQCTACEHKFRKGYRRIYVHWPTFKEQLDEKKLAVGRSPYIIPQRITCPKCGARDQYDFQPQTRSMLSLSMVVHAMVGLAEDHPLQVISLALHDGTIMHPLDALDWYQQNIEATPDNLELRIRYGNVLRTLGYWDEAEAQYQTVLEKDEQQLECWLNLAAIQVGRKHQGAAKKALKALLTHADENNPEHKD